MDCIQFEGGEGVDIGEVVGEESDSRGGLEQEENSSWEMDGSEGVIAEIETRLLERKHLPL